MNALNKKLLSNSLYNQNLNSLYYKLIEDIHELKTSAMEGFKKAMDILIHISQEFLE
jgi:hypothetical protein